MIKRFQHLTVTILLLAAISSSLGGGDEVVVIYNSRLPESKSLADFYAHKRAVPLQQIKDLAQSRVATGRPGGTVIRSGLAQIEKGV